MEGGIKINPVFAKRLKSICSRKQISQKRLRDLLSEYGTDYDVTVNTIKKWYSGKAIPRLPKFYALCEILDCSADYLLGRIEERDYDVEFITKTTHLGELTLAAISRNNQLSAQVNALFEPKCNASNTYSYWHQLSTLLSAILDYLNAQNSENDIDFLITRLSKPLSYMKELAQGKAKKSGTKLFTAPEPELPKLKISVK